jgi:hypothetical protein
MPCTINNTQAEIVAEAQAVTAEQRQNALSLNAELISNLKKLTGLSYCYAVKQARFQLQIIDRSGKRVKVIEVSQWMPFYQFNAWLIAFNNAQHVA